MTTADTMQAAVAAHLERAQASHPAFASLSEVAAALRPLVNTLANTSDTLPSEAILHQTARRLYHVASIAHRAIVDLHLPYVLPGDPTPAEAFAPGNGSDHTGLATQTP